MPEKPLNFNILNKKIIKTNSQEQNLYFVLSSEKIYGFDSMGDLRYFYEIPPENRKKDTFTQTHRVTISDKGMIFINDMGVFALDDPIKPLVKFPKEVHHSSIPFHNHYIALGSSKMGSDDVIVELNEKGEIIRRLYVGDLFWNAISNQDLNIAKQVVYDRKNPFKDENNKDKKTDWAHINSLVYDYDTDILYLSARYQGVIAVDYSDWKLLWFMSDDNFVAMDGRVPNKEINISKIPSLSKYRVQGDAYTDGPSNQHSLYLHKNGNIGMFDNGNENTVSRYVEYKIDFKNGQYMAKKVKQEKSAHQFSNYTSDVDFIGDNLLIAYSKQGLIQEIGPNGEELVNIKVSHQFPWDPFDRVDKMPLYPYTDKNKVYSIDFNAKTNDK